MKEEAIQNIEKAVTLKLIQEDVEAIYTIMKNESDPVFCIEIFCNVLSFANLIIISALHFIKDNDFNEYFILGVAALVLMPLVIVSVYQKGVPIKKGL